MVDGFKTEINGCVMQTIIFGTSIVPALINWQSKLQLFEIQMNWLRYSNGSIEFFQRFTLDPFI